MISSNFEGMSGVQSHHRGGRSIQNRFAQIGTGVMVQKELMRHSTIAMTMDGYGRGVPEANREANSRLVDRLLNEGTVQ
jgi:integrase